MNEQFTKPKGFGEILDHTFRLSKNRFADFFLILFIMIGPIYLIQAIVQLLLGISFFREVGSGDVWYEQIYSSFDQSAGTSSIGADIGLIVTGLATILLYPIAQAAILYAINHIKKDESYTVGSVVKKAFSKFWPIVGSSLLVGFIIFIIILVTTILVSIIGIAGANSNPITAIISTIILFLALSIGVGLLVTRWSFYLGAIVFDSEAPGLSRSWNLTRKRTWKLFGLYIIFSLIIGSISLATEAVFSIILGNSVLFTIIINLVTLITSMIFSVGYAIMYLDLKTRHSADDLKELIDDYHDDNK